MRSCLTPEAVSIPLRFSPVREVTRPDPLWMFGVKMTGYRSGRSEDLPFSEGGLEGMWDSRPLTLRRRCVSREFLRQHWLSVSSRCSGSKYVA